MADWDRYDGLNTRLGACRHVDRRDRSTPRKKTRTMGARRPDVATQATERGVGRRRAARRALCIQRRDGRGLRLLVRHADGAFRALPSCIARAVRARLKATSYIQMMSAHRAGEYRLVLRPHGAASSRRSSACTSGSQGIGYAYETIRNGKADVMIAGGAEELRRDRWRRCSTRCFATSTRNDTPTETPSPVRSRSRRPA